MQGGYYAPPGKPPAAPSTARREPTTTTTTGPARTRTGHGGPEHGPTGAADGTDDDGGGHARRSLPGCGGRRGGRGTRGAGRGARGRTADRAHDGGPGRGTGRPDYARTEAPAAGRDGPTRDVSRAADGGRDGGREVDTPLRRPSAACPLPRRFAVRRQGGEVVVFKPAILLPLQ